MRWTRWAGTARLRVPFRIVSGDVDHAVRGAGDPGLEARQGRDRVAQDDIGAVVDREDELAVRAGRHADRLDAGDAPGVAREARDARDAYGPGQHDLGRRT